VNNLKNELSVAEFRKLVHTMQEKRPDICIRLRLQGEMWFQNFMRIVLVSDMGLLLHDEVLNTRHRIPGFDTIIQFEIDHTFQTYEPHYHYNIILIK
jgi:hypothetical protein